MIFYGKSTIQMGSTSDPQTKISHIEPTQGQATTLILLKVFLRGDIGGPFLNVGKAVTQFGLNLKSIPFSNSKNYRKQRH